MFIDIVLAAAVGTFLYLRWKMIAEKNIETKEIGVSDTTERDFLKGAEFAFNMIVKAYHEKNRETLENLVDKNLVEVFMQTTQEEGETIPSLESSKLVKKELNGIFEENFVEFDSRDSTGRLIRETWVFAKPQGSPENFWKLVRTQ